MIPKMSNAVLEVVCMEAPVPLLGQIVDDMKDLTTQIGRRTFSFEKRASPENRDFSQLSSFHSIGESKYEPLLLH